MYHNLSIPRHSDPIARIVLVLIILVPVWFGVTSSMPPATAREQAEPVIIVVTPTLPATVPTMAPAAPMLAAPTADLPTPAPPRPTAAPVPTEPPPPAVLVAPTEPPAPQAPHVGERQSDKAPPGGDVRPPPLPPER